MSDELEDLTREELVVALRKERAALRGERARSSDLQTKLQQEQRARQEEKLASGKLQRALDLLIEQRVYDCWLAERHWLQQQFETCSVHCSWTINSHDVRALKSEMTLREYHLPEYTRGFTAAMRQAVRTICDHCRIRYQPIS